MSAPRIQTQDVLCLGSQSSYPLPAVRWPVEIPRFPGIVSIALRVCDSDCCVTFHKKPRRGGLWSQGGSLQGSVGISARGGGRGLNAKHPQGPREVIMARCSRIAPTSTLKQVP